ncbi:MAG: helix-turn-helix transcriptional regulator [Gammaproteobacteria bacterium]|nr:helix-turn-helix transcriptional regulator [Gammaproteobacteria bacterium]
MKTIGGRLNHLLRSNNVTQQELADKVKVTKQTISQLCADKIYNSKAVFPITKYFGVDLDWLLTGKSSTGQIDLENNLMILNKFHRIPVFTTRMLDKSLLINNKLMLNTITPEYELTDDSEYHRLFAMTSTNNAMKIRFGLSSTLIFHTNLQVHDGDFVIVYLPEKDLFIYRDLKIEKIKNY